MERYIDSRAEVYAPPEQDGTTGQAIGGGVRGG